MFYDTHAHFNIASLKNQLPNILNKCTESGVKYINVIGCDLDSSMTALNLANTYDNIYSTAGIHPGDVQKMKESDLAQIETLLNNKKVVAVGEMGLDYHYDNINKQLQQEIFSKQLELAKKYKKPAVIHSRDAYLDTRSILQNYANSNLKIILHCFSYSKEVMREFVKMGFYISLAGPVTFKNAISLKEVAMEVPLERLLIETDCPYLTPHPYRGELNDSSYIKYVAIEIARLRNMSLESIASITLKNGMEVFNIEN